MNSNNQQTTVTTTVRRNGRRRKNNVISSTLITPDTNQHVGKHTLRNRRRRQRQRMRLRYVNANSPNVVSALPVYDSYFSKYFTHVDPTMVESVHKLIQTQFYPTKGIHRGISNGLDTTAITLYQGSSEINTSPALGNTVSFMYIPGCWNASAGNVGQPAFFLVNTKDGISNPMVENAAHRQAGPLYNSDALLAPALKGRVVSFTLNLIPASTVLNRGGEGKIGYVSDYSTLTWTRSDIDNIAISRSWDGVESMSLHWSPTINEYDMDNGQVADSRSALIGYIVLPSGITTAWRAEWQIGIEYEPTSLYRPLVDRKVPTIRPDAVHFLNTVVQKYWTPLMISTMKNYEYRLSRATSLGGHSDIQYIDSAGLGGVGFKSPQEADIADEWINEEAADDGVYTTITKGARNLVCNVAETVTGEDVCGQPIQSLKNLGRRAVRNYVAARNMMNNGAAMIGF